MTIINMRMLKNLLIVLIHFMLLFIVIDHIVQMINGIDFRSDSAISSALTLGGFRGDLLKSVPTLFIVGKQVFVLLRVCVMNFTCV